MSAFVRTAARGVLQIEVLWEEIGLHVLRWGGSCCVISGVRPGLSHIRVPQLKVGVNVYSLHKLLGICSTQCIPEAVVAVSAWLVCHTV